MIGIDHPSNTKRGGVCIYQKECLALTRRNDICKLNECIITEITVNSEKMFLDMYLQITKSKSRAFESFCENLIDVFLGINKQQPACSILVDDFNAKLSKWCPSDKNNKAGKDIGNFTTTSNDWSTDVSYK